MNKSISGSFRKRSLRAFTLLELIVVIAIISVLMAIIIPSTAAYLRDARVTEANTQAQEVYNAVQDYLIAQQIRGEKAFGYTGTDSEICVGAVTSGGQSNSIVLGGSGFNNDEAEAVVAGITGAVRTDDAGAIQGYNTGYLDTGFEGAWLVCIYPKTYTVKYVLFCDNYDNNYANKQAKLDVLSDMCSTGDLYTGISEQDVDANNSSSTKRYVGQYPYMT